MAVNKVILFGRVGQDPRMTTLADGTLCAQFSLATSERAKSLSNGKIIPERTDWHNIVAWRGIAGIVEKYVHKGSQICVVGKLRSREYKDKNQVIHKISEVHIDELELPSKNASGASPASQNGPAYSPHLSEENDAGGENFGTFSIDNGINF